MSLLGPLRRVAAALQHFALHLGAVSLTLLSAADTRAQQMQAVQAPVKFSVPAQPLASGLLQLGDQAHLSIAAPENLIAGERGAAVIGEMSIRAALAQILALSGLAFEFVGSDAVRIIPAPAPAPAAPSQRAP
jgi:iron complex outermembrane recepter protein